jgi:hypothetical protein
MLLLVVCSYKMACNTKLCATPRKTKFSKCMIFNTSHVAFLDSPMLACLLNK